MACCAKNASSPAGTNRRIAADTRHRRCAALAEGSKVSLLEVIMRFIMIRPSHYISNAASATLSVTLASAALLIVCFGASSALADGLPTADTRLAREQTAS